MSGRFFGRGFFRHDCAGQGVEAVASEVLALTEAAGA
jgi:hypothetical protein